MGALALSLVASLATAADLDLRLEARAEGRTSTIAPEGLERYTREALLARPGAALVLDAVPLRTTARYAATIWTSDVEASPSPLVTHDGLLRLETRHAAPWRAGVSASAARGWTDPFADPVQALAQTGPTQTPLEPVEYEAFRAGADGSFPLDLRTTLGVDVSAGRSGSLEPEDRAAYPLQDGAAAQLSLEHLLSLRSTLRFAVNGAATRTERPDGRDDSGWVTGTARWRYRMTRTLDVFGGSGVLVSRRDAPDAASETWTRPLGEAGLAYEAGRLGAELSARTIPFTDRFTGDVVLLFQGEGALRWRASPRLSLGATASAGTTESGDTVLGALDARAIYGISERLSLEAGVMGRLQQESDPAPSFTEIGAIVAVSWTSGTPRP